MFGSKAVNFEALVKAYSAELYRYAYWLTRDRFVAEDLVQETFSRAWSSWETLREEASAKSWLYTILRHEHARLFERKRLDVVEDVDLDTLVDTRLRAIPSDLELREALHALPAAYREPLLLQVLGGFTCEEIAKIINTTPGAVMTRLSRARLTLRRSISGARGKSQRHEMS
ncbi:MAG TPA: sigma-70 family RNA polymerase sigma factor [Burkholderiales bacterium]|nr:sigma-70 family RNA polymerase sigma factor [Burkholderiales bacterium]